MQDWRGDKFKDNPNYEGFYAIATIELAEGLVQWDANGTKEAIPSTVKVYGVDKAQVQAWDVQNAAAGHPLLIPVKTDGTPVDPNAYNYGGIVYNNNNVVTKDFNLYIPVKVTYKWGTIISSTVTVKVKGTNVAP